MKNISPFSFLIRRVTSVSSVFLLLRPRRAISASNARRTACFTQAKRTKRLRPLCLAGRGGGIPFPAGVARPSKRRAAVGTMRGSGPAQVRLRIPARSAPVKIHAWYQLRPPGSTRRLQTAEPRRRRQTFRTAQRQGPHRTVAISVTGLTIARETVSKYTAYEALACALACSNSRSISSEGSLVSRETTTITMLESRNAGSSS